MPNVDPIPYKGPGKVSDWWQGDDYAHREEIRSSEFAKTGVVYAVAKNLLTGYWVCSCPGYGYRRTCRHVNETAAKHGDKEARLAVLAKALAGIAVLATTDELWKSVEEAGQAILVGGGSYELLKQRLSVLEGPAADKFRALVFPIGVP